MPDGNADLGSHRSAGRGTAMPPGNPTSWGAITRGTLLEGTVYPSPGVVAAAARAADVARELGRIGA